MSEGLKARDESRHGMQDRIRHGPIHGWQHPQNAIAAEGWSEMDMNVDLRRSVGSDSELPVV